MQKITCSLSCCGPVSCGFIISKLLNQNKKSKFIMNPQYFRQTCVPFAINNLFFLISPSLLGSKLKKQNLLFLILKREYYHLKLLLGGLRLSGRTWRFHFFLPLR